MRKKYSAKLINKISDARKKVDSITDKNDYIKLYRGTIEKGLNPTQLVVLNYIYDKMRVSWTQGNDYYDKKRNAYYVIVSRKTLSNKFNISESTAGETLNELCDIGYISKVQTWNSGVKVFTRHFYFQPSEKGKSNSSKNENSPRNKKHLNNNSSSSDTEHTSSSQISIDDKINLGIQKALKNIFGNKSTQNNAIMDDKKDDKHLNHSTVQTKAMPQKANQSINIIANSLYSSDSKKRYKFIHYINGMIFKFKSSIFKKHNLYEQSRWENNDELTNSFNNSIYEMLYNSFSGKRDINNAYAYFGGALRKFFNKIVNRLLGNDTESNQSRPQQSYSSVNGIHHIKEELPDWARDDYVPKYKHVSKTEQQKAKNRLAELQKKLGHKTTNKLLDKDTQSTQGTSKPKEQSVKGNGNHHIKERVPDFIEHPERHTGNRLDPKKKAEIQARLKRLNAKLD